MRGLVLGFMIAAANCATSAAGEPCPVGSLNYDDIAAAISSAPSCPAAYEVMNACLFNASGDVGFAKAVEDKCEPLFLPRLTPAQRRGYAMAGARCLNKYAGEEGSMYVSFAATCKAGVAVNYARRFAGR